jgi:hypothetical protein
MPNVVVTPFAPDDFKSGFTQSGNQGFASQGRQPRHIVTFISCTPTKSSDSISLPSTSKHSSMASFTHATSSSRDLA